MFDSLTHDASGTVRGATYGMQSTMYPRWSCQNSWNLLYSARQIRAWSEHNPVSPQRAHPLRLLFALWDCILYGKYKLRLSPKFQEILRLPPKVPFGLIPASPNIAPAMKRHTPTLPEIHQNSPCHTSNIPTSPNTEPATKSEEHHSIFTKYCETWSFKFTKYLTCCVCSEFFLFLALLFVAPSFLHSVYGSFSAQFPCSYNGYITEKLVGG